MNKKGLIFLFLFVVTTVGAFTNVNAEQSDNTVQVTLNYIPSAYVPSDGIYVEFDRRFVDNNQVFSEDDIISFAFFYDVVCLSWASRLLTTGDGWQTDAWMNAEMNNATTWNYTVAPDFWEYNTTRFAGTFNLMLDDYDLGLSNFYLDEDNGNYQDITLDLAVGWHYLSIVAAECVSDGNHTDWSWEYAKDQKVFYVAEDRKDIPPLQEDAYNNVTMVPHAISSEDLGQYYTWESYLDNIRPVAEATGTVYQTIDAGTEAAPLMSTAEVNYNGSDHELNPIWTMWGTEFSNWTEMGPLTYMWWVNNGAAETRDSGVVTKQLKQGQNFVFFSLFAFKADDFAQYYADYYGLVNGVVGFGTDMAVIRIFVGEPESTGFGFGILISVSMLGLVAALGIVRKRK